MMTRLNRRTLLVSGSAALATPALIGAAAAQDRVTLRLHQFLPPVATVPAKILKPWGEDLARASGGRLVVEHFDAMSLGGRPSDLIDQARDGVVDMTMTLPGYTPGRFPRSEVFELPFMMTDTVATGRAFNQLLAEAFQDTEYQGVKILAGWVHGPGVVHSTDGVYRLEDMKGKQLRGPTRVINALLEELGATPVGMPLPAIPEALSKGVVNGTVIPWEVTPSIKLAELLHKHTEFNSSEALYTATIILAMNQAKYDALPEDLRTILDEKSGDYLSEFSTRIMVEGDAPGRQIAVDLGNEITELDQAEVERWKAAAEPVVAAWIAEMTALGIDGQALIDRAKALIAEKSA